MRRLLSLGLAVAALAAPLRARATDVQACLSASEKGQRARSAGKLREAREAFLACGADGCPALVRKDCITWQGEIVAALPTVVFGAKDRAGRDLFDVTVSVDGEVILQKLDGKAVPVDPGPHTFKLETKGSAPVLERALVKEGERARAINVTFGGSAGGTGTGTGTGASASASAPAPASDADGNTTGTGGHTALPWITVGVGGAAMVFGIAWLAAAPSTPAGCNSATETCTRIAGESAEAFKTRQEDAGRSDAQPVEGALILGIGAALVAGGLLWHFLEPTGNETPAPTAKLSMRNVVPLVGPSTSGVGLGGTF